MNIGKGAAKKCKVTLISRADARKVVSTNFNDSETDGSRNREGHQSGTWRSFPCQFWTSKEVGFEDASTASAAILAASSTGRVSVAAIFHFQKELGKNEMQS